MSVGMTKDRYLEMCESLGTLPEESQIPLSFDDFPYEVQISINIYNQLSDRISIGQTTSIYMGKDYSILPFLFKMYDVTNEREVFNIILIIDNISKEIYNSKKAGAQKHGK